MQWSTYHDAINLIQRALVDVSFLENVFATGLYQDYDKSKMKPLTDNELDAWQENLKQMGRTLDNKENKLCFLTLSIPVETVRRKLHKALIRIKNSKTQLHLVAFSRGLDTEKATRRKERESKSVAKCSSLTEDISGSGDSTSCPKALNVPNFCPRTLTW